jgi:hypothetical protein
MISKMTLATKVTDTQEKSGLKLKLRHWNSYQPDQAESRRRIRPRELLKQLHGLQGTLEELASELPWMIIEDKDAF